MEDQGEEEALGGIRGGAATPQGSEQGSAKRQFSGVARLLTQEAHSQGSAFPVAQGMVHWPFMGPFVLNPLGALINTLPWANQRTR